MTAEDGDVFGISGYYIDDASKKVEFAHPYSERSSIIAGFPNKSILLIRFYEHGAPGMIGDDDAQSLAAMLKDKMRKEGQIHLLACSTAGVEGHAWNPVGGLGLLARLTIYYAVNKLTGNDEAGGEAGATARP